MTKFLIFILSLFIVGSTVSASATTDSSQVWIINLESSDLGYNMDKYNTNPPKWVPEMIKATNEGQGEIYIEIFNDPTLWDVLKWIEKQPGADSLNFSDLNKIFDAALTVERKRNIIRLMKDMGLKLLAIHDNPDRTDKVTIKIYYVEYAWLKPLEDNSRRIDDLEKTVKQLANSSDTGIVINQSIAYVIDSDWKIGIGSEATLVDDKFIIVPTVSLNMSQQSYKIVVTGGYWPGEEVDKKFFATSFAYFPGDHKLGLIARLSYASEAIDKGYIHRGLNLTLGGALRNNIFDLYLTAGVQDFDNQYQSSSFEQTLNLGVNFNVLSF